MKKIIKGKRYDTDTAKLCGSWDNDLGVRDFGYCEESLYRKRSGEFFLFGSGGPMSRYARRAGQNEWTGGEEIIPVDPEKARTWAEEHLEADDFEKIFGEVSEDDGKKVISLSLPSGVVETIKRGAAEKGCTMSEYVARKIGDV